MTKLMEKPVSPQRRDLLVPSVLQRFRHADQRRMVNRINDDGLRPLVWCNDC